MSLVVQLDRDLAGFKDWLRAKPPSEVVGYAGSQCDCPLARYLREANGAESAWVTNVCCGVRGDTQARNMPYMAIGFVQLLDHRGRRPVTAGECLSIFSNPVSMVRMISV